HGDTVADPEVLGGPFFELSDEGTVGEDPGPEHGPDPFEHQLLGGEGGPHEGQPAGEGRAAAQDGRRARQHVRGAGRHDYSLPDEPAIPAAGSLITLTILRRS